VDVDEEIDGDVQRDTIAKHVTGKRPGFYGTELNRVEAVLERTVGGKSKRQQHGDEDDAMAVQEALRQDEQALTALCPWLLRDGNTNEIVYHEHLWPLLAGRVLASLTEYPGATLRDLHASLPILTTEQTDWLVRGLERRGLVRRREVPSLKCGGFGTPAAAATLYTSAFFLVFTI